MGAAPDRTAVVAPPRRACRSAAAAARTSRACGPRPPQRHPAHAHFIPPHEEPPPILQPEPTRPLFSRTSPAFSPLFLCCASRAGGAPALPLYPSRVRSSDSLLSAAPSAALSASCPADTAEPCVFFLVSLVFAPRARAPPKLSCILASVPPTLPCRAPILHCTPLFSWLPPCPPSHSFLVCCPPNM